MERNQDKSSHTRPAPRDPARALTLQLLEWIAERPRNYAEVIEVWKTSCPRLSIWEDACIAGLVDCESGGGKIVSVTPKGRALLAWPGRPDEAH